MVIEVQTAIVKRFPKVSVIIPTFNRALLIMRAIKSVLDQTYQDFEVIVVDDGSSDETQKVLRSLKDERIRYFRHEKNLGASAARNTGIRAAKGSYIAFQDSDDIWLPEKLEAQMKVFEGAEPKLGLVYTGTWLIYGDRKTYIPFSYGVQKEGNVHRELLKSNFVCNPSVVVRKECFEKVGMFDEALHRLQDWEFFIRLSRYYDFKYVNKPLVVAYNDTPGNISSNRARERVAIEHILMKLRGDFEEDKKSMKDHYFHLGILLISQGEINKGLVFCLKVLWLEPSLVNSFNVKWLFDSLNEGLRGKHETTSKALIGLSQLIIYELLPQRS
jgi:glycosyltransferase involved in cell wall biosynthesis